jgi:hypothetical protein
MHLSEEHGARTEMVAADLRRRERFRVADVGVADDRQVVAVRLERRETGRREVELRPDARRRPQIFLDAERRAARRSVHHLDRDQTNLFGRGARDRASGHHRLEERKRHGRPKALEHRAASERPISQIHSRLLSRLIADG